MAPVAAVVAEEPELVIPAGAEVISLEEADAEATGKKKVPATAEAEGDEEVEVAGAEEDDTFLETEEEESGDVSDIIGGDYLERNLNALSFEGRLIQIGLQGGAKSSINLATLMRRRLTLTGATGQRPFA